MTLTMLLIKLKKKIQLSLLQKFALSLSNSVGGIKYKVSLLLLSYKGLQSVSANMIAENCAAQIKTTIGVGAV